MKRLRFPQLWQGCVGAWAPSQGATGYRLIDRSGRGNHGTLQGMNPPTDWVVSNGKTALNFDGIDDVVNLGKGLVYTAKNTMSISGYFKTNIETGSYIISQRDGGDGNFGVVIRSFDGFFRISATAVIAAGGSSSDIIDSNTVIATNTWYSFAVTFASDKNVKIYINGKFDIEKILNNNIATTYLPDVLIGARYATAPALGALFNGQIDNIHIYDKVLTQPEIQLLASRRGIAYETYSTSKLHLPTSTIYKPYLERYNSEMFLGLS